MKNIRKPTVVVPYLVGHDYPQFQDTFVYLRPESNCVQVESAIVRVMSRKPEYNKSIRLVYLANIPGDFIIANNIIERHYHLKILFALKGKKLFTPYMARIFSDHFKIPFEKASIIGAFEAIKVMNISRSALFDTWVAVADVIHVNGQSIKRIDDYYIVNYDIPAILEKNNAGTDIAVMVFRTDLAEKELQDLISAIARELRKLTFLDPNIHFSRVFHYSKGPFEQIMDATGFLYDPDGTNVPLEHIHFYKFLKDKGLDDQAVKGLLKNPIFIFISADDEHREDTIVSATMGASYEEAYQVLTSAGGQVLVY